jgi:hypothetical protein
LITCSNGHGRWIAGPGIRLTHHASEAQHDAALVGRDDEDAGARVDQQQNGDDEPRVESRRSSPREAVAQIVEDALNVRHRIAAARATRKLVRIGHKLARA